MTKTTFYSFEKSYSILGMYQITIDCLFAITVTKTRTKTKQKKIDLIFI